jgi:hypothetical protein
VAINVDVISLHPNPLSGVGNDMLIIAPIGVLSSDTDALKYIRFALLSQGPPVRLPASNR